jgi:lipoate-protein ligase A|uniref:Lipoate--protein ligase family protein n=1 Tax=Mesoaciditoga lauensis TaxID=1495039 RepID=A0A7V3VSJ3_9BACT
MIWHLIDSNDDMNGYENMAIDLSLIDLARTTPILRFYGWNPPALSLGKFQSVDGIDKDYLKKMGFDLVRRPSGGRAVLHYDELTYSLLMPESSSSKSVLKTYLTISKALIEGFSQFGLKCDISRDRRTTYTRFEACFATPSIYEVTVDGKKFVGSAQVRRNGIVLQHGSIPLRSHVEEYANCFKASQIEKIDLLERLKATMTSLEEHMTINVDELKRSLLKGFANVFDVEFEPFIPDLNTEKYFKEVKVWD